MTPEDIAEIERHEAEVADAFRKLEETADAAKRGWAKAATEVERLTVELACMTAERDGYRDQLSADWRTQQISGLMAAAGRAREERDEALKERREESAALDRVRELVDEWEQAIAEQSRALGEEWTACLRANLPALRDAIDGSGT